MEPILQTTVIDQHRGLHAWVVVDRLIDARAIGGLRMTRGVTAAEIAQLAHTMSLKLSLAGLPIGGASAGIVGKLPTGAVRDDCLRAFGSAVGPLLRGGIHLGSDQGITHRDRDLVCEAAGIDTEATPAGRAIRGSWPELWRRCQLLTACGAGEAACASASLLGLSERRRSVVIQGFGSVGRGVAALLADRGYIIAGVADRWGTVRLQDGFRIEQLIASTDAHGVIDRALLPPGAAVHPLRDGWLDIQADMLVLAANSHTVTGENAQRINARIVVEAADFPCTGAGQRVLLGKGVTVVPDIAANCGGALATALVLTGQLPPLPDIESQVSWLLAEVCARIRSIVEQVVCVAARSTLTLADAAHRMASGNTGQPASVAGEPCSP